MSQYITFSMKKLFSIFTLLLVSVLLSRAQEENPGWHYNDASKEILPSTELGEYSLPTGARIGAAKSLLKSVSPSAPSSYPVYSTEIKELAESLQKDPVRIFNYVYNEIDYEHYFGSKKGPQLTLLERSGNDLDQCRLLMELLRCSGYDPWVSQEEQLLPYKHSSGRDIMNWLGFPLDPLMGENLSTALTKHFGSSAPAFYTNASISEIFKKQMLGFQMFSKSTEFSKGPNVVSTFGYGKIDGSVDAIWVRRFFVKCDMNVSGTVKTVIMDPSFKSYEVYTAIDVKTMIGYARTQLLSAVSGEAGYDTVKNLNTNAFFSQLLTLANNAQQNIKTNNNYALEPIQVYGGKRIKKRTFSSVSEFDTDYPRFVNNDIPSGANGFIQRSAPTDSNYPNKEGSLFSFRNIPDSEASKLVPILEFTAPNRMASPDEIRTLRMDILDGEPVYTYSDKDAFIVAKKDIRNPDADPWFLWQNNAEFTGVLVVKITHPSGTSQAERKTYSGSESSGWVHSYGFRIHGAWIAQREKIFADFMDEAHVRFPTAFQNDTFDLLKVYDWNLRQSILIESLHIKGLRWFLQTELNNQVVDGLYGMRSMNIHRMGRSYYNGQEVIDIGMQIGSITPITTSVLGNVGSKEYSAVRGMFDSALEHSIIEQQSGRTTDNDAASTAKIIQWANDNDSEVYLADASNWATIKTRLEGYKDTEKNRIAVYATGDGLILLPKKKQTKEFWDGIAYFTQKTVGEYVETGFKIGNDLNGGYAPWRSYPNFSYQINGLPRQWNNVLDVVFNVIDMGIGFVQAAVKWTSADPVDLKTGAFTYENVDIAIGNGGEPRGLNFTRYYDSRLTETDNANLGYGWTHNYDIKVRERSAAEPIIGSGNVEQAIPWIVAMTVASDLWASRDASDDVQNRTKKAVLSFFAANWATKQLLNNTVTVQVGLSSLDFTKMPNGSFVSPSAETAVLSFESGCYVLRNRNGNQLNFWEAKDANGNDLPQKHKIREVIDPYGKKMTFQYDGARLKKVIDAYDRNLELVYTQDRLTEVKDSVNGMPSRSVKFTYENGTLKSATDVANAAVSYAYDSKYRILSFTNTKGQNMILNEYDNEGRVLKQTIYEDGNLQNGVTEKPRVWQYAYSASSTEEVLPTFAGTGKYNLYTFDKRGQMTSVKDALGNINAVEYDAYGRRIKEIDANGNVFTFAYDPNHNLVRSTDPLNNEAVYEYDSRHRVTKVTQTDNNATPRVRTESYTYSGTNPQPVSYTDHRNITTTYTYNADGSLQKMKGESGEEIYTYDNYGNVSKKETEWWEAKTSTLDAFIPRQSGDWRGILYTYDARGNLLSEQDVNGNKTWKTYDVRGLVLSEGETPAGKSSVTLVRNEYDSDGKLLRTYNRQSDTREVLTEYTYNRSGDVMTTTVAKGTAAESTVRNFYNENGWCVASVDPIGAVELYEYDLAARKTAAIACQTPFANGGGFPRSASDRIVRTEYDKLGNAIKLIDPLGRVTTTTYNSLNQATRVVDPSDAVISSAYDSFDNRLGLTFESGDGGPGTYASAYDANGNITSLTSPMGKRTDYTYEAQSNRISIVQKPSGRYNSYFYNSAGMAESWRNQSGGADYSYDALGNVSEVYEKGGAMTKHNMTYDYRGRVTSLSRRVNGNTTSMAYTYDYQDNIISLKYPMRDKTVYYQYDELGRMIEVKDWGNRITRYEYDKAGRVTKLLRHNGTSRVLSWNIFGDLTACSERDVSGSIIASYGYDYDANGQLLGERKLPKVASTFTYPVFSMTHDKDDKIVSLSKQGGGSVPTVTYDADGNMVTGPWSSMDRMSLVVHKLNNVGAIDKEIGQFDSPASYEFDGAGRLTSIKNSLNTYILRSVDEKNNLRREDRTELLGSSFVYDVDGRRINSYANGINTRYYVDPFGLANKVLAKTISNWRGSTDEYYYVYGLGLLYEEKGSGLDGPTTTYHYDLTGSTVALSDDSGNVTGRVAYDAYGNITNKIGAVNTEYLFCGAYGVQTDQSGLVYMQNRWYSPRLGRFISQDPIGFEGGMNFYAYANGNPLQLVDPNGLCAKRGYNFSDPVDWDPRTSTQKYWDDTQQGLTIMGFIPGVGVLASIANAVISNDRRDYDGAFFHSIDAVVNLASTASFVLKASSASVQMAKGVTYMRTVGNSMKAAGKGVTIIGETMKRVQLAAKTKPGSVILNNMPKYTGTEYQVTSQMMSYNRKWILDQMRSGRKIFDIGIDANRKTPSIFYQMEQNMLKNYQKLHPNSLTIIKQ